MKKEKDKIKEKVPKGLEKLGKKWTKQLCKNMKIDNPEALCSFGQLGLMTISELVQYLMGAGEETAKKIKEGLERKIKEILLEDFDVKDRYILISRETGKPVKVERKLCYIDYNDFMERWEQFWKEFLKVQK